MSISPEPEPFYGLDDVPSEGHPNAWKDVVAGTAGGIAQVLAGQPFDTTKVRLQSAPEGKYSGALDVVKQLIKNEGVSGFYKGTLTPLFGVGACVSVQFAVNEGMKRYFESISKSTGKFHLTYPELYISGGAAGFANSFLASPIEQIRIRLQTQLPGSAIQLHGPIDAARKIIQGAGVAHGLFRGLIPTIIREFHGMGMYFMAAEACIKEEMSIMNRTREQVSSWHVCAYGGVAGMAMWMSVYPIDVVKSRMQVDSMMLKDRKFTSIWQCWKDTIAHGYKGAFKGFAPTLLRSVPVNGVTFLAFDYTRRLLGP